MRVEQPNMSNLDDLAKISKQINERSDQVNQDLQEFEKELEVLRLGVEAW